MLVQKIHLPILFFFFREIRPRYVPSLFSQQWIAILDSFVAKWFNGSRPASSSTSVNNARRFALRPRCDKGARFYCEFARTGSPNPRPSSPPYFLFSTAPGSMSNNVVTNDVRYFTLFSISFAPPPPPFFLFKRSFINTNKNLSQFNEECVYI